MLIWLVIVIVTAYVLVATTDVLGGGDVTPLFVAAVVLLTLALVAKARRDSYAVAGYFMTFGGLVAVGALTFAEAGGYVVGYSIFPPALAVTVGSAGFMWWRGHGPDPFYNYLREHFDKRHIEEVGGVQLVMVHPARDVPAGGAAEVKVFAQNGFDEPRTLHFALKPERRMSLNAAGLPPACLTTGPWQYSGLDV